MTPARVTLTMVSKFSSRRSCPNFLTQLYEEPNIVGLPAGLVCQIRRHVSFLSVRVPEAEPYASPQSSDINIINPKYIHKRDRKNIRRRVSPCHSNLYC